jgi:hypothetical protein
MDDKPIFNRQEPYEKMGKYGHVIALHNNVVKISLFNPCIRFIVLLSKKPSIAYPRKSHVFSIENKKIIDVSEWGLALMALT